MECSIEPLLQTLFNDFKKTTLDMKVDADQLIQSFSFDAKRYKDYADKELREIGKTHNYARLCGLADAYRRAQAFVKQISVKH